MTEIAQGAEAVLTRDGSTVTKERVPKRYRHPELDERLRSERTEQEARLLEKARQAGVTVPAVETVAGTAITLQYVDGTPLRDALPDALDCCVDVGRDVARLHARNIIHGDLTTSNILLADDALVFIDFGLGFYSDRVEDRATDLHLLKEVFASTHTDIADEAMERVWEGYSAVAEDAEQVQERFEAIATRGRYR